MSEIIQIIDFGSQYTQLIARRIRQLNVYCEIHPYNAIPNFDDNVKGVILSGSPHSTLEDNTPDIDIEVLRAKYPVLGVCYGAQLMAKKQGGKVEKSLHREYGRAFVEMIGNDPLFNQVENKSVVWMSHGDSILELPDHATIIAKTNNIPVAAFKLDEKTYGIQFHPEVTHSECGLQILENFVSLICGCACDWTAANFINESVSYFKNLIGNDKVIMGLSGGVDSSVAAYLLHQAIGPNLIGIFVNNGLLRKYEYEQVLETYKQTGLNVIGVDASELFYEKLKNITEPEQKRKIIGNAFIDVFDEESKKITDAKWLGQGTIYPDVIESISVKGPSATIKSHHNVGGLPDFMKLKLAEPLRTLFKDEVREIGKELKVPSEILGRHPFPGPGLGIRIIGDVTPEKVNRLQEADYIFISELKNQGYYNKIWQAGAIYLPVQSVGVMGDERTYENVIALRAVSSLDGMTADWVDLPHSLLADISNKIINQVKGINRVVYDISSKPPATIEWE